MLFRSGCVVKFCVEAERFSLLAFFRDTSFLAITFCFGEGGDELFFVLLTDISSMPDTRVPFLIYKYPLPVIVIFGLASLSNPADSFTDSELFVITVPS